MSFRAKLIFFAVTLIAILAIPVIYYEIQRPWRELYVLIEKTEARLGSLEIVFDKEELKKMNQFTLEMVDKLYEEKNEEKPAKFYPNWANSHAFNMLLDKERLLTEEDVLSVFKEEKLEFVEFKYEELVKCYQFWDAELDKRPGIEAIFRKYRNILLQIHENCVKTGFEVADVYVMLDVGQVDSGFFKENIAIVLDSLPWWESSYPGDPYNLVKTKTEYWRESYDPKRGGRLGFHHDKVFDPERWYLPAFTTDEWGTWFGGWKAKKSDLGKRGTVYNSFSIDFNAATVNKLMFNAAIDLALITVILVLILVLATRRFSLWLTRPISALTEGAEAVMTRKYDHVVPKFGNDEFSRLTEVFNRMIQWVKEMVNLKETLTKLLSSELAEMAASEGLVLGGQEIECTIMFTDFAGFSTLTKNMSAAEVVEILNMYFGELIPILKNRGGFPDKYIGDAIVAVFGAPVRFDNHAEQAVLCAIEMQRKIREINDQRRKEGKVFFEMRIGLNTGIVVAGAIGCDLKLEYTSIGETTNLANRMEAKCKIGHVLMSENTYRLIEDKSFAGVFINNIPEKEIVKGYREEVNTYGIYIQDLKITKNMNTEDLTRFYEYETVSWEKSSAE